MAGYEVINVASNDRGMLDAEALARMVDDDVAAIMITNPNTLGVFEDHITEVARILHAKGALVYMDGANMNALAGISRPGDYGVDLMHLNLHKTFSTPHGGGGPGSGPVAVKRSLEPFLPLPRLQHASSGWSWNYGRPQSIGRVRAFYGNFGVLVRALAYIMAHGGDGLKRATLDALLNANYLRKLLESQYEIAYQAPSMHECVFRHPDTGAIAKRLIDYGFHPYTVSFPLIVHGAMMIEPTETESKQELDLFADALVSIAQEVKENPDLVLKAPHSTRTTKVDEVAAARKPILKWSK
jgi:glycine dehydrogenase subunit 2